MEIEFKEASRHSIGMIHGAPDGKKAIMLSLFAKDKSEWMTQEMSLAEVKELIEDLQWSLDYLEDK